MAGSVYALATFLAADSDYTPNGVHLWLNRHMHALPRCAPLPLDALHYPVFTHALTYFDSQVGGEPWVLDDASLAYCITGWLLRLQGVEISRLVASMAANVVLERWRKPELGRRHIVAFRCVRSGGHSDVVIGAMFSGSIEEAAPIILAGHRRRAGVFTVVPLAAVAAVADDFLASLPPRPR